MADLANREPTDNNAALIDQIKIATNDLARLIGKLEGGRRKSIAITHLETASMFAVKAAAIGDN